MWFGREGRHGVCMVVNSCCDFQTITQKIYIFMYLCLYFMNNLFNDHVNSFSSKEKKKEKKKG